jgi:hypothetical protein
MIHLSFTLTTDPDLIDALAPNPTSYREALARAERELMESDAAPTDAAPDELTIRVRITARKGGLFEARAVCELEGQRFEGEGTDANARAAVAAGGACARLILNLAERWEKVDALGPDVVVRDESRALIARLDRMFRPLGLPPRQIGQLAAAARDSRARPAAAGDAPLVGELLGGDDDDDDDDDSTRRRRDWGDPR